jgi:hypothetical protein
MAKRIKVGSLYGIPLPNGKFAFGRIMRDAGIAIYSHIGVDINDIPTNKEYQFVVGIYKTDINKDLIYIKNIPFEREELEWPPPSYIYDVVSGKYEIYHKGEIHPSSKEKCIGLEAAAVWHTHHIIDRIMGYDKWRVILKSTDDENDSK